jgi:succinate dehydrogenase / fumarate reductase cytochrome b subunit
MSKYKYALFTGCTAKESTPELLKSTLAVADMLGIELDILEEASCCGASHLQDFDDFLSLVLNARNICYAEKRGLDLVTICNTCQINTSMTKHRLDKDQKLKDKVNEKLKEVGLEYKGTSKVIHFLYVLQDDYGFENIKTMVKKPLKGIEVAPFYGCHNIRPSELQQSSNSKENPYNPRSLDDLILAIGGNNVEYEEKNKCCGFHVELQNPEVANKLSGQALLGAVDNGADMIATPCPLCHLRMDVGQKDIEKEVGREISIPILHMPQLIGLALGLDRETLGLNHHMINVPFIDK